MAKAETVNSVPAKCEEFRAAVQKYFGAETDNALFVAFKESGCRAKAVGATKDYCLFQIHKEPKTLDSLDFCIKRAWDKYVGGRVGENNWSAWYAVCTPQTVPKYPNIKCK